MSKTIKNCCKSDPKFLVTYSVAGQKDTCAVCDECIKLDFFSKFVIESQPFDPQLITDGVENNV